MFRVRVIPGKIPASKEAKKSVDWSKDASVSAVSIAAIGILRTLMHS